MTNGFQVGTVKNPKLISSRRGVADHQRESIIIDNEDFLFLEFFTWL